jgi:mono/diheme cytochrome c family protein
MRGLGLCAAFGAAFALAGFATVGNVGAEPASASPREKYILFCAGCHGLDGEGGGGGGGTEPVPPFGPELGVFLRDSIGRAYLVNVGGVSSAGMTSAEAATVLNYILQEFGRPTLPDDFEPYTESEVDAFRKTPLDDPVATRREIRKGLTARGYTLPPYQWEG